MKSLIVHIVILLFAFPTFAQQAVTALSQNDILIGEKITLSYSIPVSKQSNIRFEPQSKLLPSHLLSRTGKLSMKSTNSIEVLGKFKDTVIDQKMWIGIYEITAWDSGFYLIEGPRIVVDGESYFFPDISLKANLVKQRKGQGIYGIKESFTDIPDEPFSFVILLEKYWIWLLLVLLVAIMLFIYKRLKRKSQPAEVKRELNLQERTLLAIESLEKERLWEKGKLKEHYIELSFIMRSYLSNRYSIHLLEKTTHETQLLLLKCGLNADTVEVVQLILNESDLVKFAKSQPDENSVSKMALLARQVVAETSPIEFENA